MSNKKLLEESNNKIINLIKENKPFIISRLGGEISITYNFLKNKTLINSYQLQNNAGIYNINKNNYIFYIKYNKECLQNSNFLASFKSLLVNT